MLKRLVINSIFLAVLVFFCSCSAIFTFPVAGFAKRKDTVKTNKKSISKILEDARVQNIYLDKKASKELIISLSSRNSSEFAKLSSSEKDALLNITVAGFSSIGKIFDAIYEAYDPDSEEFDEEKLEDDEMKKKILSTFDIYKGSNVVQTLLSDKSYIKTGAIDSIVFAFLLLLSNTVGAVGYDISKLALEFASTKDINNSEAKKNLEILIKAYYAVDEREDIDTIEIGGISMRQFLPSISAKNP